MQSPPLLLNCLLRKAFAISAVHTKSLRILNHRQLMS